MLLAIIMDVYTDVKSHVHDVENLHAQLETMVRRWKQNRSGERINLKAIERGLMSGNRFRKKISFSENQDDNGRSSISPSSGSPRPCQYTLIYTLKDFINC